MGFAFAGCDQGQPRAGGSEAGPSPATSSSATAGGAKVLARVNGVPITELDVKFRSKAPSQHEGVKSDVVGPVVIETLIRDELVYQRAVELGLDKDPEYLKRVQEMEAQLATFKRRQMVDAFYAKEVHQKTEVPEAEVKAYFDRHSADIRAELHVMQLLYTRDPDAARAASDAIKGGKSFEEVAKERFKGIPPQEKAPWDLGFMKWNQLPEAWWDVVFKMKPGEVSDVISGGEQRFWVLKLVERRDNPNASFEDFKPRIISVLKRTRVEERRAELLDELKKKAKIEYVSPAPPASAH